MALINLSTNDSVAVVVDKINQISNGIGDTYNLLDGDSNACLAVNELVAATENFDESAEMIKILRSGYSAVTTSYQVLTPMSSLRYTESDGIFRYDRMDSAEFNALFYGSNSIVLNQTHGRFDYDSVNKISGTRLNNQLITINKISSATTFSVRDENGAALVTIHSPAT